MIRVLIADDHEIVRAGLRQFISEEPDIKVTGEAASGDEVMAQLRDSEFDVLVLDISMPVSYTHLTAADDLLTV